MTLTEFISKVEKGHHTLEVRQSENTPWQRASYEQLMQLPFVQLSMLVTTDNVRFVEGVKHRKMYVHQWIFNNGNESFTVSDSPTPNEGEFAPSNVQSKVVAEFTIEAQDYAEPEEEDDNETTVG